MDQLTYSSNTTKRKASLSSLLVREGTSTFDPCIRNHTNTLKQVHSLFSHKKEFGGVEPCAGQPVSFVRTATDKGDAATKVRKEESVPEPELTDEGREFGKVKVCEPLFLAFSNAE